MSLFNKIKSALTKTSQNISKIGDIFTKKGVSPETLEDFEEILLSADFGIQTTEKIIKEVKALKFSKDQNMEDIKQALEDILYNLLKNAQQPLILNNEGLNIIVFCGVNGNGKTTTISKLANYYKKNGKEVVIAACDTFRSAAVEQLKIWAERIDCKIISGNHEADPASVAYQAIEEAKRISADVLMVDTAGRLQNQQNLMDELTKIIRVVQKANNSTPYHTILTLDASTGQNAFSQVEKFKDVAQISGIIFTKLDGTAKGGAIVGIIDKYHLPIHYLTTGETMEDFVEFDARNFAKALIS